MFTCHHLKPVEQGSIGSADDLSFGGASHIADVLLQRRLLFICAASRISQQMTAWLVICLSGSLSCTLWELVYGW